MFIGVLTFACIILLVAFKLGWIKTGQQRVEGERPPLPPELRAAVYERNEIVMATGEVIHWCTYCGRFGRRDIRPTDPDGYPWEVDHVYPFSRGGPTGLSNLTLSCRSCNRAKGATIIPGAVRPLQAEESVDVLWAEHLLQHPDLVV